MIWMTEAEWLAATDPTPMLQFLRGRASDRRFRLFAVGCLRAEELTREAPDLRGMLQMEEEVDLLHQSEEVPLLDDENRIVGRVRLETAFFTACDTARFVGKRRGNILRDIIGNPFRPVAFDPSWRTSTVVALANQMYESRDFSPMPVLADALQDAGCDQPDILAHCRDPQPAHVRGCWVVDLILGKS